MGVTPYHSKILWGHCKYVQDNDTGKKKLRKQTRDIAITSFSAKSRSYHCIQLA